MRIVSVPGRLVLDPATGRPVDEAGITIDPTDLYWARLLADGDVAPPLEEIVAAVIDQHGKAIDPPAGDIAAAIAAPAAISPALEH